jgi:hypothetical protein
MITGAALITVSCVLFVQMGLSEAALGLLHIRSRILSCPKCLTFWSTLLWSLLSGHDVLLSIAASFICAYAAMWAALLIDGMTVIYNKCYESISKTNGSSEDAEAGGSQAVPEADSQVPKMQEE